MTTTKPKRIISPETMKRMTQYSFNRKRRLTAQGLCGDCGVNPLATKWHCDVCKTRHARWSKNEREKTKEDVFAAYGGQKCSCPCNCDVTEREYLTIDHIGGRKIHGHAKSFTGHQFYRWLKRNNFPPGFRVLCMNCNFALGHAGYCPRARKLAIAV